ncbi:non-canonical purine NTP pyrophosphatase [Candidatus Dojkabacteria bacterium]|uniref:Non-canonical purine NTP pyrophosphatase n=1 Tax=Candidatus Dojkabacteria bacterium TaxID=2099670 RepID=A0A955LA71_9BACT|nr:non-canonical purine NTP pyrophosphatase [Candidatus Dojkabacteria bacterium]
MVPPRGGNWGWDPVLEVKKVSKTFGEMDVSEKNKYSMRAMALRQLKDYLS